MMSFKSVTLLILIGLFIIICIQNVETIPLHFIFWSTEYFKITFIVDNSYYRNICWYDYTGII